MPVKIATNYPGVRCYEHTTRTYKRRPDRYFSIRYRTAAGKRVEEGVGWASEGWTAEEASRIRSQIRQNTKLGTGPQSLQAFSKSAAPPPQSALPQTFEDLALCYLKWAERNKKSWTTDYYLLTRRIFPLFGDRPVASITRADMERFRDALTDAGRLSPMSIKHHLIVVRRVYNWAATTPFGDAPEFMHYEGRNPVTGIRMPLIDNERARYLTRDEADRLLDAAVGELRDVILLALLTGMRRQEILGLSWQDIDMGNRVINIPARLTRTKRSRKAFLDDELVEMLQRRKTFLGTPKVFPGRGADGTRDGADVSRRFNIVVARLGLNDGVTDERNRVVFHTLRHTFASWLAQAGVDTHELMELTGHKTFSMLRRYAHLMPERTRAAAALVSRSARSARSVQPDPSDVPPESSSE